MASTVISKPMRGVVIPDAKPPPTNNKTSDTPTSSSPSSIPSSSSKGSIRADPESQLLLEDNRALHKPSLFSIYYMQLCNSTAILITVPTADEYSAHVGISADLSGVVVGMFPLVGVLGAYPCYYGVKRVGFTFVVAVCAVALVIGSVMYAFAWSATSPALLLCGRALQGFFQYGPGSFDYVAMAVPIKKRTTVMLYNAVATTAGYSVGPFLAFAICKICEAAGWNGSVMNEATGVGWMLALLNGGLFFLAVVVMRNPAPAPSLSQLELRDVSDQDEAYEAVEQKEKRSVRQELKDVNIPAVLSLLYICFTLAAIITVGDVFSVQNAQDEWNWDIDISAVYIGTIMLVLHARQSSRTMADQENAALRSRGNPHALRSCCRHLSVSGQVAGGREGTSGRALLCRHVFREWPPVDRAGVRHVSSVENRAGKAETRGRHHWSDDVHDRARRWRELGASLNCRHVPRTSRWGCLAQSFCSTCWCTSTWSITTAQIDVCHSLRRPETNAFDRHTAFAIKVSTF